MTTNCLQLPFYRPVVNVVWCSMWSGILYVAVLLAVVEFKSGVKTIEYRTDMTMVGDEQAPLHASNPRRHVCIQPTPATRWSLNHLLTS